MAGIKPTTMAISFVTLMSGLLYGRFLDLKILPQPWNLPRRIILNHRLWSGTTLNSSSFIGKFWDRWFSSYPVTKSQERNLN